MSNITRGSVQLPDADIFWIISWGDEMKFVSNKIIKLLTDLKNELKNWLLKNTKNLPNLKFLHVFITIQIMPHFRMLFFTFLASQNDFCMTIGFLGKTVKFFLYALDQEAPSSSPSR